MSVVIVNNTATNVFFPDIDKYHVPASGSQEFPLNSVKNSSWVHRALLLNVVHFDMTLMEWWEMVELGLLPPDSPLAQSEMEADATYKHKPDPASGMYATIIEYPLGSGPGDPAIRSTFTYGDPAHPKMWTKIITERMTLP